MKEKFKQAFEKYYENLSKIYSEVFDSQPTISYNGEDTEIDKDLIISKPNEDGETAWKLKEVGDYDFSEIEERLGFTLNEELKAFYSSYLFLHLAGDYEADGKYLTLYFDALKSQEFIEKRVLLAQKDGNYYFEGTQIFALGSAVYNDDDTYVIFYDNKTSKVFIYENDTQNKIELNDSLIEVISNFEVIL